MKEGLFIIARGIGQVMFQNNALSGLLMLAGIACNSWILALLALAGNIVSTLTACLCKYSREDIRNGLYGFNGTLVGIAIGVFMEINISSMFLLLFGSALSTGITRLFNRQRTVPGFTAPFIITVWISIIGEPLPFPHSPIARNTPCFRGCSSSAESILPEHRAGHVSRRKYFCRITFLDRYPCQFPDTSSLHGLGSLSAFAGSLTVDNRFFDIQCRITRI